MAERRVWRRVGIGFRVLAVGLVVVVLAAAGVLALIVEQPFPQEDGSARLPGLQGSVEVVRDEWGVPQIYADSAADLFTAQGYVHAQDRFWEMDVRRHISAGRLSELFGAGQVSTDKVIRTIGWYRVAEREVELLSAQTRSYLDAYAAGVNAYLGQRSGMGLSLEYAVLGLTNPDYRPQPWTPADSVSWLKAMAWELNSSSISLEVQRSLLTAKLPRTVVDELYPSYDYRAHRPIVGTEESNGAALSPRPFGRVAPGGPPENAAAENVGSPTILSGLQPVLDRLDAVLGPSGSGVGSNSWVVAGSRTSSGKPLLANDPHLAPQIPGIWHQIGLHCRSQGPECPFEVAGFGFSGLPGVVIGHNAAIGWGLTDLGADVADLYLEKVQDDRYSYDGQQLPLHTREETIKVAGGEPVRFTVRATGHGPIISDVEPGARDLAAKGSQPGHAVALRWAALDPSRTLDALFRLNQAQDWRSFRAAVADFSAPAQNIVYADRQGHIGYQTPGSIPQRRSGDGRYPVPGWTSAHDWTGYLPFDSLPSVFDPPKGYIVTANNAVVGPDYPNLITKDWGSGYRSQRIIDLIEQSGPLDPAAMGRIQQDSRSANAARLAPFLLGVTVDPSAQPAQELLRDWDFQQPPDSAPAAYFNAVWRNLLLLTFTDELSDTAAAPIPDGGGRWFQVVSQLLDRPDDPWWRNTKDPRGLRTRDDTLRAAMQDAARELTDRLGSSPRSWRWGELHTLVLRNQTLGSAPVPVRWLFNRGEYQLGGGNDLVNATAWRPRLGYEAIWGPSMRMVVDLADLDASTWVNQTGVSGHAFSPHYVDQSALLYQGRSIPWAFTGPAVSAAARHRLELHP